MTLVHEDTNGNKIAKLLIVVVQKSNSPEWELLVQFLSGLCNKSKSLASSVENWMRRVAFCALWDSPDMTDIGIDGSTKVFV